MCLQSLFSASYLILHQLYEKAFWKEQCNPQVYMLCLHTLFNSFFPSFITSAKTICRTEGWLECSFKGNCILHCYLQINIYHHWRKESLDIRRFVSPLDINTSFFIERAHPLNKPTCGEKMRRKHRYTTGWQWLRKVTLKNEDNRRKGIFAFSKKYLSYSECQLHYFKAR